MISILLKRLLKNAIIYLINNKKVDDPYLIKRLNLKKTI
jgi:hypothetical protein